MKRVLFILVSLLLTVSVGGASDGRCIQQTRYWGGDGPAQHLVVIDGHAFFGGYTLRVADLADPTDPTVVHEVRLNAYASDLASNGRRIYVVDSTSELTVIDAAVPYQAKIEGEFVPEDPFYQLHLIDVHGDLAVVEGRGQWTVPAAGSHLTFMDVSGDAPEPATVGSIEIDGIVAALALGDRFAVVVTRSHRMIFIDVSDPTAPAIAAEVNASDWLVSGEVRYLEASGNLLAVSDSEGRVTLADISLASEPKYLSLIQGLDIGVATVEFEGPTLHAVGSICTPLGVCGGYALINILAPRSPNVVGRVDGPKMISPVPHAGHVTAAAFTAGLRVVDLRGLTNPAVLDVVLPARQAGAIASADRFAHVVDVTSLADPTDPERNVLRVLERSPDGALTETAAYGPEGAIWALAAAGNYAAAAIYDEESEFHSVEIVDVADPTTPVIGTRLGARVSVETETYAPHLRMHDNRLYLSLENSNDILIYELSPGGVARQVGDYSPGAEMLHFAISSKDVMSVAVRDGDTGWIEVVDTRVPSSSVAASVFELPDPADVPVTVEAERTRVAVLCRDFDHFVGPYNLSIVVDVSDPAHPVLTLNSLVGGWWIAITSGVLHTIGDNIPPVGTQHFATDVTNPPDSGPAESLGRLEIYRDRVDADGPYFCLSRNRLEVHHYGACGPLAAKLRPGSATE